MTINKLVGFLSMTEKDCLQSVIRKSHCYGFLPGNFQNACDIVESLESNLFRSVCANPQHVLFRLLPPEKVNCATLLLGTGGVLISLSNAMSL